MAKFYVSCGPVRDIFNATSAEHAALMALDGFLDAHRWVYDDPDLDDRCRRDFVALEALLHLESEVRVSQRGFCRSDAARIGVPELIEHWHRLMCSIARLSATVGQPPRPLVAAAAACDVDWYED